MKKMLLFLRRTGLLLLLLVLPVLVYLLSAFLLSRLGTWPEPAAKEEVTCYILTNGVHTDLVVPVRSAQIDWSREVRFENTARKDTAMNYLALGWGDKGFYLETPTWADLKFRTAFRAAFGLSTSAIHATFYKSMKEGPDCVKIPLSAGQYSRLVRYLRASFRAGQDGQLLPIATTAVYGANDAFYEARGRYSLFHTCNTWANNGLKRCGQKASVWTPFDTGIFYHYQPNNK